MDSKLYFQLMQETSDITDQIILKKIQTECSGDIEKLVLDLPLRRAKSGKPKSRPAIFRFAYEAAGGTNWRQYEKVAAALEMLNISTYTLNYVFDDKGGEKSKQQRNNECMASIIQRELAQDLLREGTPQKHLVEVDKKFSDINKFTSGFGQYLDGNSLRQVQEDYLENYLRRCQGLTGIFMGRIAEIGGVLAGAEDNKIGAMGEYGRNYGTLVQITNDLGDYLPANIGVTRVGKVYQDQYSDLRHGCLTFPAYYVLQNGNPEEIEAVKKVQGNVQASEKDCEKVTKAIIRLNGVKEVRGLSKDLVYRAREALHVFPKSQPRDFLSSALSTMTRSNVNYRLFGELGC